MGAKARLIIKIIEEMEKNLPGSVPYNLDSPSTLIKTPLDLYRTGWKDGLQRLRMDLINAMEEE